MVVQDGCVDLFEGELGVGLGDFFGGLLLVDVGVEDGFDADAGSFDADVVGVEDVKVGDRFHGCRPVVR